MGKEKLFESEIEGNITQIKAGLPDLHVTYLGVTIEIELKAENGTVSPLQERTMEQLNKAKIISMVLRPSQINELVGLLDAMSKTQGNKDEKENCDNE